MISFKQGKILKKFQDKKGEQIILRLPIWEDFLQLTDYVNKLSKEDTYLGVSGEQFSVADELKFWNSKMSNMQLNNSLALLAISEKGEIVGLADIDRDYYHRQRGTHRGKFGISIKKEYRGRGIGFELTRTTIEEAKNYISNLKIINLSLFEENYKAKKLYEKIGFKEYGSLSGGFLYRKKYQDEILMYLEV